MNNFAQRKKTKENGLRQQRV